jgi:uncharacterized RDD family membrane protein YckC
MTTTTRYAGINKRLVAFLIDEILLTFILFFAFGKAPTTLNDSKAIMYYFLKTLIGLPLIGWIYFAGMESSSIQATLGKKVLGIIVTTTKDNKISFGRATARHFAKSIFALVWIAAVFIGAMAQSTGGNQSPYWGVAALVGIIGLLILVIGYLMVAFTPEKQALHDIISKCLVVNGSIRSGAIPWKLLIGLTVAAIVAGRILLHAPDDKPVPPPEPTPSPSITESPLSSPTPTPTESTAINKDKEFEQKIIGTWETKRVENNLLLIAEESFYSTKELSGYATVTNQKEETIYIKYSGTWRVEDGYLYYKITSSNHPEIMPIGDINANKIINITDKDYVYIDNNGNQQVDRRKS